MYQVLLLYLISNINSLDQQIKPYYIYLLPLLNITYTLLCLLDRYSFLQVYQQAFLCFLRVFQTIVQDSFWPDLEGVTRYAKFVCILLAIALKTHCLPLGVSFGGFLGHFVLANLFSPVLTLTCYIMPAIVDLVRSSRHVISDKVLPALYQVQTAERFSGIVSRLAVTGSEGIWQINREGDTWRHVSRGKWARDLPLFEV